MSDDNFDQEEYERIDEEWHDWINSYDIEHEVNVAASKCEQEIEQMVLRLTAEHHEDIERFSKYIDEEQTRTVLMGAVYGKIRSYMQYNEVEVELFEHD